MISIDQFDEIGYWSEVKLDIIKEYAAAYSRILASQKGPRFEHIYIDGFAGAGIHISKATHGFVLGSPLNALSIKPPFKEYHLIDLDGQKTSILKELTKDNSAVTVYEGDCNKILLNKVFPRVQWGDYRRGLCLLDPYGLQLNWEVIKTAGKMRSIDMFLNFPVMDINRSVLWNNPEGVPPKNIERLNSYWGDESWKQIAYEEVPTLFGPRDQKVDTKNVVEAFHDRLQTIAGFQNVLEPLPMRNSKGAVIYYLFFASQKPVATRIVKDIFGKYMNRGIF